MKAIKNVFSTFIACVLVAISAPCVFAMEVQIVQPEQQDEANKPVVKSLQNLLEALANRNLEQIRNCLSDEVSVCVNSKDGVIYGRDAVMEHIKKNVLGTAADAITKKITVYRPYVTIKSDTAMVSFQATKEVTGSHPQTLESWCSEVFERSGNDWKVIYFQSNWKPAKPTKQS
jgi:hypothetical protein